MVQVDASSWCAGYATSSPTGASRLCRWAAMAEGLFPILILPLSLDKLSVGVGASMLTNAEPVGPSAAIRSTAAAGTKWPGSPGPASVSGRLGLGLLAHESLNSHADGVARPLARTSPRRNNTVHVLQQELPSRRLELLLEATHVR